MPDNNFWLHTIEDIESNSPEITKYLKLTLKQQIGGLVFDYRVNLFDGVILFAIPCSLFPLL